MLYFCLYCDAWSCKCSCMGSMSVSSCTCSMLCASYGSSQCGILHNNNNNNCLKSNIQCIEIRVQWTVHLGSSHMHVHAVTRVHAVTPKLVICVMYLTSI